MLGLNFIILVIGARFFWARLVGTVLNCLIAILIHIPVIGILFLVRENPLGNFCTKNIITVEYVDGSFVDGGFSYQDDGNLLSKLFWV